MQHSLATLYLFYPGGSFVNFHTSSCKLLLSEKGPEFDRELRFPQIKDIS